MFVALWEFEVKPGCQERFERVYSPNGDWARLFRSDSQYIQTRLVKDSLRERVYLTMDFWESREAYEEFMLKHKDAYAILDAACQELTIREAKLDWTEVED